MVSLNQVLFCFFFLAITKEEWNYVAFLLPDLYFKKILSCRRIRIWYLEALCQ